MIGARAEEGARGGKGGGLRYSSNSKYSWAKREGENQNFGKEGGSRGKDFVPSRKYQDLGVENSAKSDGELKVSVKSDILRSELKGDRGKVEVKRIKGTANVIFLSF